MKKEDEDGKQLLTGITSNRLSDIRDQVILSGTPLKEKKNTHAQHNKKRLDE
jgi:hypothetical protein